MLRIIVVVVNLWMFPIDSQFLGIGKVEEADVYEYAVDINMYQYPFFALDSFTSLQISTSLRAVWME